MTTTAHNGSDLDAGMTREQMADLVEQHVTAEAAGDVQGTIAVNTDDVEHQSIGTVPGELQGVPGHGKAVNFRMLHVFEFRDGLISRETVWLDGGTIIAQLSA